MLLKILYESFRRIHGPSLTIVAIAISAADFWFGPDQKIALKWLLPFALLGIITIALLIDVAVRAHRVLPSVRSSGPSTVHGNSIASLLVSPSPLFGQDALVSIFAKQGDFEVFKGMGYVLTIQENGFIHVVVQSEGNAKDDEFWKKIQNNNADTLKTLMVKPTISRNLIGN